ncbi:MAG: hypothetical protein ACK5NB_09900 [Flavobacteriaceae bacterium]
MAKQIKAIQCPKCGSVDKTQIKEDHYICKSCNTEYFLDNDNINVVYHNKTKQQHSATANSNTLLKVLGIVFAVLFGLPLLVLILVGVFSSKSSSPSSNHSTYSSPIPTVKKHDFYLDDKSEVIVRTQAGTLLSIAVGKLDDKENRTFNKGKEPILVAYFNEKGEETKREKLGEFENISTSSDLKLKYFENGLVYLIIDKTYLFAINSETKTAKQLNELDFAEINGLETGIAECEFSSYTYAINVLNNKGENLMYYPIIKKTFNKEKIGTIFGTLTNGKNEKQIDFTFTGDSHDFPDEKIQLIRYAHTRSVGYPVYEAYFRWNKDYGGSGIFTDKSPYKKVLLNDFQKNRSRIVSFEDFTPGRTYFAPKIIGKTETFLLITVKSSPGKNAKTVLQALNLENGEILWSNNDDIQNIREMVDLNDGFAVKTYDTIFILNDKGVITNSYKSKINNHD